MYIEFLGADREVTGSCHFVSFNDTHILVDCGMEQGADLYVNQEIPVNPAEIAYVFVTHAHIDHSGLLPLLYNHGFRGKVYATKATCELCDIMLKDSAHIQENEAEWRNRKARRAGEPEVTPLYGLNDVLGVMSHFVPVDYHERIKICDGLEINMVDAGHLLGSASIEMWITEGEVTKKLVFSGDVGNGDRPIIKDPEYLSDADYVIMESTYGNRVHDVPEDYSRLLADVLRDTFSRGGNVVIPAFAVGRTQEMLYHLRRIKQENMLPQFANFEVYIDSPLAVEATNIFHENVGDCYREDALKLIREGVNPIKFPGLKIAVSSDESKMINFIDKPKVIISASGMCEAGRVRHHLKHNLWREDSTILFVGFQVPGTLGNALLGGVDHVKLFGEEIEVKAKIIKLPGISGHADRPHLIEWLKHIKLAPKGRVFIVHGEESVALEFADSVHDELGIEPVVPFTGDTFDLETGVCIEVGDRALAQKKPAKAKNAANTVFNRLVAAGARLVAVIQKCQGMANKDLAKLADQINAICDKWDR